MKIFKNPRKSILAPLCAATLLFCSGQMWGMKQNFYNPIDIPKQAPRPRTNQNFSQPNQRFSGTNQGFPQQQNQGCYYNTYNRNGPYNPIFPFPCKNIQLNKIPNSGNFQCSELQSFPSALRPSRNGVHCTLFTQQDDVMSFLIGMIKNEKKSIQMAAYLLTNNEVINELIEAKKRKVRTVIILDKQNANFSCAKKLTKNGIEVYIYKPKGNFDAMHNKFIVFRQNVFGRPFTWTGSFNFTYPAYKSNQENVVICDKENSVNRFGNNFKNIKTNLCSKYQ